VPKTPLFSDFQQNTPPYSTDLVANEETGADMFLNWVHRQIGQVGFANMDWRPWTCGGCADVTLPGDSRLSWIEIVMAEIFVNRGWN